MQSRAKSVFVKSFPPPLTPPPRYAEGGEHSGSSAPLPSFWGKGPGDGGFYKHALSADLRSLGNNPGYLAARWRRRLVACPRRGVWPPLRTPAVQSVLVGKGFEPPICTNLSLATHASPPKSPSPAELERGTWITTRDSFSTLSIC